eukprot:CAMPEP_0119302534 /NCGR_PEP_ID=MMETSP1333-20130426/4118_1 /TAXON_ID=418940 /ORGANISM="Scyphosphaera apsteinii, Strain RCC1455" /LENGTH=198 /DNA_ID=CAMNT_0007304917 /DNA_START=36 /DNA_END=632 /DNA_ORIENTATION=+
MHAFAALMLAHPPAPPPSRQVLMRLSKSFELTPEHVLAFGSSLLIISRATSGIPAAFAEEASMTPAVCSLECNKECNIVAPGNKGYCESNCKEFCESQLPMAGDTGAASKDCSGYKTDKAQAYCATQNTKALMAAETTVGKDLGIFGDSGISYSKGVEELFATAFGATRQNQNVNKANVGAFASDIASAAVSAASGGK